MLLTPYSHPAHILSHSLASNRQQDTQHCLIQLAPYADNNNSIDLSWQATSVVHYSKMQAGEEYEHNVHAGIEVAHSNLSHF